MVKSPVKFACHIVMEQAVSLFSAAQEAEARQNHNQAAGYVSYSPYKHHLAHNKHGYCYTRLAIATSCL